MLRREGEIWRNQTSLLRSNRPSAEDLESKIVDLIDKIRGKEINDEHTLQLTDMIELLIDENNQQSDQMEAIFPAVFLNPDLSLGIVMRT